MAITLSRTCPYCGTRNVAQTALLNWQNNKKENRALFSCGHCSEAIIYEWNAPLRNGVAVNVMQYGGSGENWGLTVSKQWPSDISNAAPSDTPPSAARYFEQAVDSLHAGNFDASGIMFRKSLESAIKALSPDPDKKTLAQRIKALAENHAITPALAAWANEVRLGGNDAAHEDDPFSREDAESLYSFSENFMRYAFTLPSAVHRRSATSIGGSTASAS